MRFVNELFTAAGQGFPISEQMVGKLLAERGHAIVDDGHHTTKRRVGGARPRVWDVPVTLVTGRRRPAMAREKPSLPQEAGHSGPPPKIRLTKPKIVSAKS